MFNSTFHTERKTERAEPETVRGGEAVFNSSITMLVVRSGAAPPTHYISIILILTTNYHQPLTVALEPRTIPGQQEDQPVAVSVILMVNNNCNCCNDQGTED